MKIFLIFALLSAYLSAEIYQCDGIGNSKPEAQENAKQSAVASSSTYIKSEFNSDISTQSQNKSYILKTIASGIARIINGSFSRYDNQNYIFSGTCEVKNEAITKTEEILKKIKEIDYKFSSKISKIKSEYQNLQLKISSLNNNQTQQTDFKKQISQLESQINDFNSVENRIYQNINYKLQQYFTSVSKKSEYLNQKFLNLKSDLNSIDSEIDSKIENIEYQIDSLKTEIDSKFDEVNSKINYIYFGLGGLLLLILPLFFRRKDKKLEQVADISVVDSRVQISTPKKKYSSKEKMSFSFSHKFDKESYFYILDINLRNETTLLYPTQKDVNLIQPNQTVNIPNIDVVPPFGDDILKIIASPIPLEIPEIVYSKESKIFADSRGFKNPEIEKIESEIAENKQVSPLDLLGHFRGQASKNRITIFENHIKIKTFE